MIAEIKFACSHCGQKIAVGSDAAGLDIECPTCQNPVTIPRNILPPEPRRADGGSREKLSALQAECERLRAAATHSQAEIKSFQSERLALRAEVAALRQRATQAEAEAADVELLRQRLEATETQIASLEREISQQRVASSESGREAEQLRNELAAANSALAQSRAQALEAAKQFAEASDQLKVSTTAHTAALAEMSEVRSQLKTITTEAEMLRGLVNGDGATRDYLSTKSKLEAAEEELKVRRQSAAQLEADLKKADEERIRLEAAMAALQQRLATTLMKAEEFSEDRLHADNVKLRELLDRQNEELKIRFRELTRFRRAKLTLKIVWALSFLAMVLLAILFLKVLPTLEWAH